MCLILFAYQNHSRYKLILAANRDEFYNRPAAPMAFWDDVPDVLGGRDLKAGGTWFGITRNGRWSAITNFRNPELSKVGTPSRGFLVSRYLLGQTPPDVYLQALKNDAVLYSGFNLLVGDCEGLYYFSNRQLVVRKLGSGTYGLSNNLLNVPWPKVVQGREALTRLIVSEAVSPENLFAILADRHQPDDADLPHTGVGREWERIFAPRFISSPIYGTRTSTIVLIDYSLNVLIHERTFQTGHEPENRCFEFQVTNIQRQTDV